ncbi:hypothetical protein AGABI1DRAFT_112269 [Agaricus bisporus var. burnettii JB137-S8]|uniref:AB hydrolase-1 domain-containing protein n=2 Tax=Agaricus bisporus var. burnettii TaxID=192524 RepID=K5W5T2_AGABU|nr:uncharacterized protein AGABI1DRAFT_112269 [Agaricus bisporus var. burnettii JB137-S8]EKM82169.1 hypothetical protein AGABI1DRAFT_112269 [Agaricus bisporus var. burnettii JB137-S8]KAF7775857.1 hypothetical protein Agabi119p4_4250 [Agaricus bisporus var. burnettii]
MDTWSLARLRVVLAVALLVLVLSLILLSGLADGDYEAISSSAVKDFYWIDIKPSHDLVWHPCYNSLRRECARLLVPLDHLNHSDENPGHAAIALIRVPSPLLSTPRYRGPILFNPGGPGGSGVDLVNKLGDDLALVVGEGFDVVSFDPRGVARSTPKVNFFDGPGERAAWGDTLDVIRGGPNDELQGESGRSIEKTWARAVVTNKLVGERGGDWLGNINTEQTAHDMLSIVKAYGREKLMYWGFSYGTILGSTFAALFPDNVERMVLDGVVDSADYYATAWNTNLLNTSETLNQFFTSCHQAGPSSCPFWAPTPTLISANLTRIYHDLVANPIPVRGSTAYGVLDYSFVRQGIFAALYAPYATWPALADALAALGGPQRDPTLMWNFTPREMFKCSCSGSCDDESDKDEREKDFVKALPDGQAAILCSDGESIPFNISSSRAYLEDLSKTSEWADIWANIHISCTGWPKAKKPFRGPIEGNTSFPILFIGNTADPVTPLVHARTMSKRFPGSRVLTQDSPGHCSINSPSICTQAHVQNYFLTGTLPAEGTICPVIMPPFPPASSEDNYNDVNEGVVVGDSREKEMVFDAGEKKAENFGSGDASEILMMMDEKMKDVVVELSKAWKPFNRPLFG